MVDQEKIGVINNSSFQTYRSNKYIYSIDKMLSVRKMDPRPIYFGFWCLMTNTTKLDQ